MKLNILFLAMLLLMTNQNAYAIDPMKVNIRTHLPEGIKTVGQAAQYYAAAVEYRLTVTPPAPMESYQIAMEMLSPLARTDRILPVNEAILGLLKENYFLLIDTKNKLFSFKQNGK
jgi:hypothetical protein